jgi:hypothetical protein
MMDEVTKILTATARLCDTPPKWMPVIEKFCHSLKGSLLEVSEKRKVQMYLDAIAEALRRGEELSRSDLAWILRSAACFPDITFPDIILNHTADIIDPKIKKKRGGTHKRDSLKHYLPTDKEKTDFQQYNFHMTIQLRDDLVRMMWRKLDDDPDIKSIKNDNDQRAAKYNIIREKFRPFFNDEPDRSTLQRIVNKKI